MGANWLPSLGAWLTSTGIINPSAPATNPPTTATPAANLTLSFGDGKVRRFSRAGTDAGVATAPWASDTIATDTLTEVAPSSGSAGNSGTPATSSGPQYDYRSTDESVYRFNAAGQLLTHTQRSGWVMSYAYNSAGQLVQITNQFGRSLTLAYHPSGQISQITQPDGQVLRYDYTLGSDNLSRLSKVTYPALVAANGSAATATSKQYLYELSVASGTTPAQPHLLTGVIDESGARLSTYRYDAQGRATETTKQGNADRYQVSYGTTDTSGTQIASAQVTDPLGTQRNYNYSTKLGQLAVTTADKPSGQGLSDAASRVQSALGLIESETDYLGFITTTAWDTTRRLPTAIVRASGRPEQQTSATQWHPTLRLPTLVTESGRTTAFTYDALGNKLTETVTDTSATGTGGSGSGASAART